jgi:hypothetical protein
LEEQKRAKCLDALLLTYPHVDRESLQTAKGERVAGTCEWIAHDVNYRAWLNSDDVGNRDTRLLWISGGPGKGKTMMSIFLTEWLEKHTERIDNSNLVFFFCTAQDEERNTAVAVLRSLIRQIIAKRPQLVKHALPYFETTERIQQRISSLETLWIIFRELAIDAGLGTMFCVLDGLDECNEGTLRGLVPRLVTLFAGDTPSSIKGAFKLAIISRDMPYLRGRCTRIRLDRDNDEKVDSDIKLFVSARVEELSWIEGFDDDFRASTQAALLERAGGTFLWVGFAMYELSQKQTCTEIDKALEDMPRGLPAIYTRMLLRIPARKKETSRAILLWVATAARPLNLQELDAATGVRSPSSRITEEQAMRDAIACCGPLLKLQEQEVNLIHQSARDYLLRGKSDSNGMPEKLQLDQESAHLELEQKCLDCIAQSGLQHTAIDLRVDLDPRESPLLRYATIHWLNHVRSCSELAVKLFDTYELFLQEESPLRDHWWGTYNDIEGLNYPDVFPFLHMACDLEIIPWVEAVLAKRIWSVNQKDGWEQTALHWAVEGENEIIVQLLVDRGADIEANDNRRWTALHIAAMKESETIVQLLLNRGAEIKAKNSCGQTALDWVVKYGTETTAQLLKDRMEHHE